MTSSHELLWAVVVEALAGSVVEFSGDSGQLAGAAADAAAASRWVNGPYGPHTCVNGYVWREAFPGDDVCVIPDRRSQAAADNAAAASRFARPGG